MLMQFISSICIFSIEFCFYFIKRGIFSLFSALHKVELIISYNTNAYRTHAMFCEQNGIKSDDSLDGSKKTHKLNSSN